MRDLVVEFSAVRKRFGERTALEKVDFDLTPGEVLGFIGPNGCGKTTAVRLMLGFLKPTDGSVRLFQMDPSARLEMIGQRIGVMLEQPGTHDCLTAEEYLRYFAGLFRVPESEYATRIKEVLNVVELSDRSAGFLKTFSKGMRQRISLARCLLNRPELMILDEPFDGLDVESRQSILRVLADVSKNQGTAVFVTSHNLAEVEEISDRIAIVKSGRIMRTGTLPELKRQLARGQVMVIRFGSDYPEPRVRKFISIGEYNSESHELSVSLDALNGTRGEFLRRVFDSGLSIESVADRTVSLQDVYLDVTQG